MINNVVIILALLGIIWSIIGIFFDKKKNIEIAEGRHERGVREPLTRECLEQSKKENKQSLIKNIIWVAIFIVAIIYLILN